MYHYFLKAGEDWTLGKWWTCWNWVVTDPTCGNYRYRSRQKFEGQPPWPPLSPSHKPWKPTWVHSCNAFSTDLLQLPKGLLNVKKLLKGLSSLCQKECANLFLYQQLKVHFLLWGVCVCICVCATPNWSQFRFPECISNWLQDQGDLTCLLLQKHNYWKSGKWDSVLDTHFFNSLYLSSIVPLKGLHYYH